MLDNGRTIGVRGVPKRFFMLAGAGVALLLAATAPRAETRGQVDQAISRYLEAGQADSAFALVEAAIDRARAESQAGSLSAALYADSLGHRFFGAYEFTYGIYAFERGIAIRESVLPADALELAAPVENLATAYYIAARYEEAVAAQERVVAIKAAKLSADDPSTAKSRLDLAIVYFPVARYGDAERELHLAIAALQSRRDSEPLALAETEQVLGEVCRELNRYAEAEEYLTDALALARRAMDAADPRIFNYLNSLAGYYKDQARYDESELLLEEAFAVVEADASLAGERAALTLNLAEVQRLQGRYPEAVPLYRRAIDLATQSLAPLEVAIFHNQIASAYAEMDRAKDAEAQYRQALAVADSASDASPLVIAQFKNDLGVFLARAGRAAEGEALLEEAIALREGTYGPNHPLVAVSLTQLARAQANLFVASSKRTPRDGEAAALLDRALAMWDSTDAEPEGRVDAGVARARLYYRGRQLDRAAASMASALDAVEALRPYRGGGGEERIEFVRRYVDAYDRMAAWQVELGNAQAALDYSERRRARVLVDRLSGTSSATLDDEARAALERLRGEKRDLEKELGSCQAQARALREKPRLSKDERSSLASIETRCDRVASELQRTSERIRGLERGSAAAPAKSAKRSAPPGEALLVYHIGTEASFLFVVEGNSTRGYPLRVAADHAAKLGLAAGPLTRASISQLLFGVDARGKAIGVALLRQLATPVGSGAPARAIESMNERLHALFVTLMPADVWPRVRVLQNVTVVPDGPLAAFPFEACVTVPGQVVSDWLGDGPVIRYAPSLAALDALAARTSNGTKSNTILSVCNPHYAPASKLSPLPGTEREAESVVTAFGKNRVTTLCGDAATEFAVRKSIADKEVVHLATHGLVAGGRSDLLSSLALTPASPGDLRDDGFLHLFEIYDLSLAAELVVLSACESSAGNYVLGEGVMALARGFLSAGARRVVATQWKVDDDATAALVGDFLARVAAAERAQESIDYARALRDAKRASRARAEWSQPFYWAAFVISGAR